jgi:DNA-binding HxlR family transcriptional regulator/putative sterol carrier protein
MATARTYGDGCAIARALDVVGERWALLVVRELLLGPKRFTDLRRGLPNASPNVLSERLRELERAGVVVRRKLAPPAGSRVYELTEWGLELEPLVLSLGRWGARSPAPPGDAPVRSGDSVMLSLRGLFDARAADGLRARYELRMGEDRFRIEATDGALEVARGGADDADATLVGDPDTLNAVLWGGLSLTEAQRSGRLTIDGDRAAAKRLVVTAQQSSRRSRSPNESDQESLRRGSGLTRSE